MQSLKKDDFNKYYLNNSIKLMRALLVLSSVLYTFFGIMDFWLFPEKIKAIWLIRLLSILSFGAMYLITYTSFFKKYHQYIMFLTGLLIVNGLLYKVASSASDIRFTFYYCGLFSCFISVPILLRLRFLLNLFFNVIVIIEYTLVIFLYVYPETLGNGILILFISSMAFACVSATFSSICSYYVEYYLRKDFTNMITINDSNHKLKELDRAKSNFFSNISHEFRTPLTLILSPIEAIIQGDYGRSIPTEHPLFVTIHNNILRLLKLINNLLDLTKLTEVEITVNNKNTNIPDFLEFHVSSFRSAADSKNQKLAFNNKAHGVVACIDRDLLEKIISNLLSNAFKFTPAGGSITVTLDLLDSNDPSLNNYNKKHDVKKHMQISVTDTGVGIPEEKLETIFERFSQLDNSIRSKYNGTGIGLALTREIVHFLNGEIFVKSKPGEGTNFTVVLPLSEESGNETSKEDSNFESIKAYLMSDIVGSELEEMVGMECADSTIAKEGKILIVEDNRKMLSFLASTIGTRYKCITAVNGLEGIRKTEDENPDLIVSDVMMPEMDGYEMTRILKNNLKTKPIPIILLTAKSDMEMRIAGLAEGANDYITKPFNVRELMARINSQLEMKKLRDEVLEGRKALEDSEIKFRNMAELLPVGIIEVNQKKLIEYTNTAAVQLMDKQYKEDLVGRYIHEFISYQDLTRFEAHMKKSLEGKEQNSCEYGIKSSGNATLTVLVKMVKVIFDGRISGVQLTFTKIEQDYNLVKLPDENFYKEYEISQKEKEVLIEIIKGLKNREIADKLYLSEITIKKRISSIYQKTGTACREDLLRLVR